MRSTVRTICAVAVLCAAGLAAAGEPSGATQATSRRSSGFGVALTIGEGIYFYGGGAYRGPVSLEVLPSFGGAWIRVDLGLATTLESVRIEGTHVGDWNFTFRPGARLTSPSMPLYLRVAFPLVFRASDFDWGVLFGLGADFRASRLVGIMLEVDTTLTRYLQWGTAGLPLEFRAGVSFHF